MTLLAGLAGWSAARVAVRWIPSTAGRLAVGAGAAVIVLEPALALALVVVPVAAWWRRLGRGRAAQRSAELELALLGELLSMSLTAGMPLTAALSEAAGELTSDLGVEVRTLLRRARRSGLSAVLADSQGRGRRLYLLLARAHSTGAPVAAAVAAFVHEQRDAERARALEAARRLPVRLMVPLALLVLPGFAVLTVGPSVLVSVRRLVEPLVSSLPPVVGRLPT